MNLVALYQHLLFDLKFLHILASMHVLFFAVPLAGAFFLFDYTTTVGKMKEHGSRFPCIGFCYCSDGTDIRLMASRCYLRRMD